MESNQRISISQFLQITKEIVEGDEGVEVSSQRVVTEEMRLNVELGSCIAEGSHASEISEAQGVEGIISSILSVSILYPPLMIKRFLVRRLRKM